MAELLKVNNLSMHFRGLKAVQDFSASLAEHGIYGLIGTNGAGKTTVINMLSGVLKPTAGTIEFAGRDITAMRPDRIARLGILRTYQNLRLFRRMTALENVIIGAQMHHSYSDVDAVLTLPCFRVEEDEMRRVAREMLALMGIERYADERANSLPYGAQRKLEIARILAARPRLLLLDEPAAGMNPQESAELVEIIRRIRETFGLTILLIEHDMKVVMGLTEYIYVMATGQIIAEGKPDEVRKDQKVITAYLGRKRRDA
ncbi:MAG TPA: ABC transporter ATP-binding protein [Clostridiales bacterium]|jgi:branched-chain amino acid transport system ATP-binding protein|nr:ABC transporter ATP-binding protein [Clostridiales bacterium]